MDVTEDAVRDICTDAVFERGERYLAEGRIHEIHRVDTTVTAVVSGSRQYDVRVDLATGGFAPWCDCPYDGPGACNVVAVLLRCVDDPPSDNGDRLDAALGGADADELRAFLRDELATDTDLRDRFLARVGEPMRQSVDELRTSIDRRFEETNPEYHVVFEPIDFTQWFDPQTSIASRGEPRRRQPSTGHSPSHSTRTWSALTVRTTISRVHLVGHSTDMLTVSQLRNATLMRSLTPSHFSPSGRCREHRSSRNTSRRPRSNSRKR